MGYSNLYNIEDVIAKAEANLQAAPPGFAAAVMRSLPHNPKAVPLLNKRLCAAVCFSSAAAFMIFMLTGFDRHEFIVAQSGRLSELFALMQSFMISGTMFS